jgi:hypothetical protein
MAPTKMTAIITTSQRFQAGSRGSGAASSAEESTGGTGSESGLGEDTKRSLELDAGAVGPVTMLSRGGAGAGVSGGANPENARTKLQPRVPRSSTIEPDPPQEADMMAIRLVRLIETHADRLAHGLLHKFLHSPHSADLKKVPAAELKDRSYEIYRNLNDWLTEKSESEIEHRYIALGQRRAAQGVSLSHLLWAITATKEHLWDFLQSEGFAEKPVEVLGELELLHQIEKFFDRALYYAAIGYERASKSAAA